MAAASAAGAVAPPPAANVNVPVARARSDASAAEVRSSESATSTERRYVAPRNGSAVGGAHERSVPETSPESATVTQRVPSWRSIFARQTFCAPPAADGVNVQTTVGRRSGVVAPGAVIATTPSAAYRTVTGSE